MLISLINWVHKKYPVMFQTRNSEKISSKKIETKLGTKSATKSATKFDGRTVP